MWTKCKNTNLFSKIFVSFSSIDFLRQLTWKSFCSRTLQSLDRCGKFPFATYTKLFAKDFNFLPSDNSFISKCVVKIQYNPWNNVCGDLLLWSFSSMKNVKSVHLKTLKQIVTMAFRYEVCGNLLLWSFTLIKNVTWSNFKDQQKFC